MTIAGFRRAGHLPTLIASFLYFDVSFMVWVMLGPLGPFIGDSFKLSATQKGFMVALPLLAGSFFRPILGALGDRIGGRKAGLIGLSLTIVPLVLGWQFASSLAHIWVIGCLLGICGASFAVALPLAGRWYPPEFQGLAMGIAGAGNMGSLVATLFATRIAAAYGWHTAFLLAMAPVTAVLIAFWFMAKDSPAQARVAPFKEQAVALKEADTGWLCFLYSLTFGGFVGFSSFLTIFFRDQYHLSKVTSGDLTTMAVFAGSALRPVGGWLADRIGGYRMLLALLTGVALCLMAASSLPQVGVTLALLTLTMGMLGMGNGAVFQILPQRFPTRVGILTGIVGAAGGLGGFFLPSLLGVVKDRTGEYGLGLTICAGAAIVGAAALFLVGPSWLAGWDQEAARRAGVFSYRDWSGGFAWNSRKTIR